MKTEDIPDKMAYRLEEICRISQLEKKVIESWEKEFYFLHAGHTATGKKYFRKRDLDIILRLKELLENQGMTLAGAKRKIEEEFGIKGLSSLHPDKLKNALSRVKEQLQDISLSLNKK
jgi:DNA-binding transcriptional MerR regulator